MQVCDWDLEMRGSMERLAMHGIAYDGGDPTREGGMDHVGGSSARIRLFLVSMKCFDCFEMETTVFEHQIDHPTGQYQRQDIC